MRLLLVLTSTIALLCACSGAGGSNPAGTFSNESASPPLFPPLENLSQRSPTNDQTGGRVRSVTIYTLSNSASRNAVVSFVSRGGALRYQQSFDTGGLGDPSVAGTVQGAIAISAGDRFLFAVDAGSNEITSFRIGDGALQFIGKVASGGMQPVSLTVHGNLLFVLNAGSSSIAGFRISRNGGLRPIPKSSAPLSGSGVGPAEIAFDPSGNVLLVTEKSTNDIDTYSVAGGIPTGPSIHASSGMTPFGFAFAPRSETVVVSEAFGGASGEGAASSYSVTLPSTLTPLSVSVPDQNTAPCWIVVTSNGVAFTSNTGSNTISAYSIDTRGDLTLADAVSAQTGTSPTDLALGPNDGALYVLNLKSRTIGAYAIGAGGALSRVRGAHGLPKSTLGLAALPSGD
jgi:6-phosphogluconolactonase (cycloisomerase 2 family)